MYICCLVECIVWLVLFISMQESSAKPGQWFEGRGRRRRDRGENRYGGGFSRTQTDSRPAVPSCTDPSLAGPRLQTAATCLYQNNTTGVTAKESRHGPAPALPHASIDTPPSPVLPSQAIRCRAHLATRVCCRYQERTQCCLSSQTPGYAPQKPLHGWAMATFVCRVQFLDDTDPFNSTNFPEPTRPPLYTFREDIPLINQLTGIHRLLKAPHKVWPLSTNY